MAGATRTAHVVGALLLVLALAGCSQQSRSSATGPTATIPAESARADARDVGRALLSEAVLPPGARATSTSGVAAPLSELGCAAVEGHSSWRVPGTLDAAKDYLVHHVTPHLRVADTGTGGDRTGQTNIEVTESVPTAMHGGGSSLVYSAVRDGSGGIDLRVDAEVVIAHETCVHFGPVMRKVP